MARDGIWKVQIKSNEAIQKKPQFDEESNGLGFKLRFKTGEYVKDADADESTPTSSTERWF